MNPKIIKIAGAVVTVVGALLGICSDKICEEKMKIEIHEEVAKALAETTKES